MNAPRRYQLAMAAKLIAQAREMIEPEQAEERDADAASFMEDAMSRLDEAEVAIEDACKIKTGRKT